MNQSSTYVGFDKKTTKQVAVQLLMIVDDLLRGDLTLEELTLQKHTIPVRDLQLLDGRTTFSITVKRVISKDTH